MSNRWDVHFLDLAATHARMSKDPSTRVGSVIVGPDREIRSVGFNGFPRGIEDTYARLHDRDTKLKLVVHGEMNAMLVDDLRYGEAEMTAEGFPDKDPQWFVDFFARSHKCLPGATVTRIAFKYVD